MKADPRVMADLLAACGTLATLAEQFRIDRRQLKTADIKWLASVVGDWYDDSEKHLCILLKRLAAYGGDLGYSVGKLVGTPNQAVGDLLQRELASLQAAFDQLVAMRTRAMQIRNDGTPDDYEHAVQFLEKAIWCGEQQMNLIGGLGTPSYVSGRLEDE